MELMHKLVDLKDFSLYVDTNTTLVGDLSKNDMAVSNGDGNVSEKLWIFVSFEILWSGFEIHHKSIFFSYFI